MSLSSSLKADHTWSPCTNSMVGLNLRHLHSQSINSRKWLLPILNGGDPVCRFNTLVYPSFVPLILYLQIFSWMRLLHGALASSLTANGSLGNSWTDGRMMEGRLAGPRWSPSNLPFTPLSLLHTPIAISSSVPTTWVLSVPSPLVVPVVRNKMQSYEKSLS